VKTLIKEIIVPLELGIWSTARHENAESPIPVNSTWMKLKAMASQMFGEQKIRIMKKPSVRKPIRVKVLAPSRFPSLPAMRLPVMKNKAVIIRMYTEKSLERPKFSRIKTTTKRPMEGPV